MIVRDGTWRIVVTPAVDIVTRLFARSGDQAHVDVTFSCDIWELCGCVPREKMWSLLVLWT